MGTRGVVGAISLVLSFVVGFGAAFPSAVRAQEEQERRLPGCGICFPGGYDLNTVGRVQGRLLDVESPIEGPVRIHLNVDSERWVALASPAWHWRAAAPRLLPGDTLIVRGSKTLGADGTLYIVAQEVLRPGSSQTIVVRGRDGAPLWRGRRGSSAGATCAPLRTAP